MTGDWAQRQWRLVVCGAALSASLAAPALGDCRQWSLAGPIAIEQANGLTLTGNLHQAGGALTGEVWFVSKTLQRGTDIQVHGTLNSGSVQGDQARFHVSWWAVYTPRCGTPFIACEAATWKSVGVYEATIGSNGHVSGVQFDMRDPGNKVAWTTRDPALCRDSAIPPGAPPPASPVRIVHIGKRPALCIPGYVWREAGPTDRVCVTPESRSMAARENAVAGTRRDPNGAYGPNSCVAGFVWREAFQGDAVCVTPERRAAVRDENNQGPRRTQ